MIKKLIKFTACLLLINLQGCYAPYPYIPPEETISTPTIETPLPTRAPAAEVISAPPEQAQIYNLFLRSMQYQGLAKNDQKIACEQLKQDYDAHANWQTAWLLVYAINSNFNCINLKRSLVLLQTIQEAPNASAQLQWLNSNQINLLNNLRKTQSSRAQLRSQLKKTQTKLEAENSKIEALKAIESDINKKLANAEMQLQKENSKIEALKTIETDINKKLDE